MKPFLILLLSLLAALHTSGQKLKKPEKNKKTGVTTISTERESLTSTKTTFLGSQIYMASFSIAQNDTGSFYISFSGQMTQYRFRINKGDSIKIAFTDGETLWLPAQLEASFNPTRMPDNTYVTFWNNYYLLNETTVKVLKEKDLASIGVAGTNRKSGDKIAMTYTVVPEKKDAIKKALALF